jgi:uncharacterized protein YjiS (DUF1127 family)
MSNLTQCRSGPTVFRPQWSHKSSDNNRPLPWMWRGALHKLLQWFDEQRQRRDSIDRLRRLDRRLLQDIGIDRDDIEGCVDRLLRQRRGPDQRAKPRGIARLISIRQ